MIETTHSARARCVLLGLGVCALAGAWRVAQAGAPHPHQHARLYKHQIEALEGEWRTAQLANDVPTMDKLLAPDYLGIAMNGQINDKAQQLERMRTRTLTATGIDLSELKIKLVGKVAIVTSLAKVEGVSEGVPMHGMYRYTRIYRRYPDGVWRITNFEVTPIPGSRSAVHAPDAAPGGGASNN